MSEAAIKPANPVQQEMVVKIIEALKTVRDPEIPVNIYDLGLVYEIRLIDGKRVALTMTLTTPACPVAQSLPAQVEQAVRSIPGIEEASAEVVWDPPWSKELMSEEARLALNLV